MVGDSSGHGEDSPSRDNNGKVSRKRASGNGAPSGDPRDVVMRAAERGRLDSAQAKALLDLTSRMGVLGFENSRVVSDLVIDIAYEDSTRERAKLVRKLREYLESDGLAKDLVPVLSGAFKLE